jgi:hypothetical protein
MIFFSCERLPSPGYFGELQLQWVAYEMVSPQGITSKIDKEITVNGYITKNSEGNTVSIYVFKNQNQKIETRLKDIETNRARTGGICQREDGKYISITLQNYFNSNKTPLLEISDPVDKQADLKNANKTRYKKKV